MGNNEKNLEYFKNLIPFLIKLFAITSIIVILLANIDDISSTFKHVRRAAKDISRLSKDVSRLSKDVSQTLSVEQTVVKVVEALDKYQTAKETRNLLSKYKLLTPVDVYASNSLADYPVTSAFDSNPGTFWHSSENEASLVVSLNLPSKLEALSIISRPDIPGLQGPDKFIIKGSDDNKNWDHIDEVSQLVWKQGETKMIPIESNSKNYMYYKFDFTRKGENEFVSIVEMMLYSNYVNVKDNGIN